MIVAAYIRCSSDQQMQDSPERQKQDCFTLCEKFKLSNPSIWYAESKGRTGLKRKGRDQFAQLLIDAEDGKFDVLVMSESSRLGREKGVTKLHLFESILECGVRIFAGDREIKVDDLGQQITELVKAQSELEESRTVAERSASGKRAKWQQGDYINGLCPGFVKKFILGGEVIHVSRFGDKPKTFMKPKGSRAVLEVTENHAELIAVKELFNELASGVTLTQATRNFNDRGVRNRLGGVWIPQTVRGIVQRREYVGEVEVGKHSRAMFSTVMSGVLENLCPAIIDRDVWHAANAAAKLVKLGRPTTNGLLAGLVFDEAGFPMYSTKCSGKPSYKSWVGPREPKPENYTLLSLRSEWLERAVMNKIQGTFENAEFKKKLREELIREVRLAEAQREPIDDQLSKLKEQIATVLGNIGLLSNKDALSAAENKLNELQAEQAKLEKANSNAQCSKSVIEKYQAAIDKLPELFSGSQGETRAIISAMLKRIIVQRFGTSWSAIVEPQAGTPFKLTDQDIRPHLQCHQAADFVESQGQATSIEIAESIGLKDTKKIKVLMEQAQACGRGVQRIRKGLYSASPSNGTKDETVSTAYPNI